MSSNNHANNQRWKQQTLPAWEPIFTFKCGSISLFFLGIVLLILGGCCFVDAPAYTIVYSELSDCALGSECNITFTLDEDIDSPVYVYYGLTNFYQTHRSYVTSRSTDQLRAEYGSYSTECEPLQKDNFNDNGTGLQLYPCGAIAASYFSDVLVFSDIVNETGIAWESDIENRYIYRTASSSETTTVTTEDNDVINLVDDVTDEHFIVWMKPAVRPNFRKLYGIIHEDLLEGDEILVYITNNYDTSSWDGEKSITLSGTSWIGGENYFLAGLFIVTGIFCILFAIGFLVLLKIKPPALDRRMIPGSPRMIEL